MVPKREPLWPHIHTRWKIAVHRYRRPVHPNGAPV